MKKAGIKLVSDPSKYHYVKTEEHIKDIFSKKKHWIVTPLFCERFKSETFDFSKTKSWVLNQQFNVPQLSHFSIVPPKVTLHLPPKVIFCYIEMFWNFLIRSVVHSCVSMLSCVWIKKTIDLINPPKVSTRVMTWVILFALYHCICLKKYMTHKLQKIS